MAYRRPHTRPAQRSFFFSERPRTLTTNSTASATASPANHAHSPQLTPTPGPASAHIPSKLDASNRRRNAPDRLCDPMEKEADPGGR